ncbi:MAG TPA: hypothetical protein VMJ65_24895 [Solirubrobacteraceae bacterium]|nr:hypothetical protein [Solirubrobacteraceae bacterium]
MTLTRLTDRRELAQRTSDGIEVTLFWSKSTNKITLEVLDSRSAERLEFDVDSRAALDAFNHPYVYAIKSHVHGSPTSADRGR